MLEKEEVTVKFDSNNRVILEKKAARFGNSAHVVISQEYFGEKVKIIVGKSNISGKKLIIDFSESEILERKASKFGTGCHVIIPKEYVGKKIKIIVKKSKGGEK